MSLSTVSPVPARSPGSTFATFTAALADQAANLQAARDSLDEAAVTRAVGLLLKAPRVFIAASGASHHVASFLEDGLALYLDADVTFASSRTGPERAIRHMMSARRTISWWRSRCRAIRGRRWTLRPSPRSAEPRCSP